MVSVSPLAAHHDSLPPHQFNSARLESAALSAGVNWLGGWVMRGDSDGVLRAAGSSLI